MKDILINFHDCVLFIFYIRKKNVCEIYMYISKNRLIKIVCDVDINYLFYVICAFSVFRQDNYIFMV